MQRLCVYGWMGGYACRSAETSTTRTQKRYFDESFGPFYRTQQVIMSTLDGSSIVSYDNLNTLFEIQDKITAINVVRTLSPTHRETQRERERGRGGGVHEGQRQCE
jgi:hypothetical protein